MLSGVKINTKKINLLICSLEPYVYIYSVLYVVYFRSPGSTVVRELTSNAGRQGTNPSLVFHDVQPDSRSIQT